MPEIQRVGYQADKDYGTRGKQLPNARQRMVVRPDNQSGTDTG